MQRVDQLSKEVADIIEQSINVLSQVNKILDEGEDALYIDHPQFREFLGLLKERFVNYKKAISRSYLKCVFVGRTSSGKSSTINALLKSAILPSGFGHTTNCFITIKSTEKTETYVEHFRANDDKPSSIYSLDDVKKLASAVSPSRVHLKDNVQINIPRSTCKVLTPNVYLMDTPGLDIDDDFDKTIDEFCLDADLFVLVCNAEAILMQCERNFFLKVKKRFSKPNILIINNRWDSAACLPEEETYRVKQQHLSAFKEFLTKDLKLCTEKEVKSRVFFVSMLEENRFINDNDCSPNVKGRDERAKDFQRFETTITEMLSDDSLTTKYRKQFEAFEKSAEELNTFVNCLYNCVTSEREIIRRHLSPQSEYIKGLENDLNKVHQKALNFVNNAIMKTKENIVSDFRNLICQLDVTIDTIKLKFNPYDKKEYLDYQKLLVENIEIYINSNLDGNTIKHINDHFPHSIVKLTNIYRDFLMQHKPSPMNYKPNINHLHVESPQLYPECSDVINKKIAALIQNITGIPDCLENNQKCIDTLNALPHRFSELPKSAVETQKSESAPISSYPEAQKSVLPETTLMVPKFNSVILNDFTYSPGFKFTLSPTSFQYLLFSWTASTCPILTKLRLIPYSVILITGMGFSATYIVLFVNYRHVKPALISITTLYLLLYSIERYQWNAESEMLSLKNQFIIHTKYKMETILVISASSTAKQMGSYLYLDLKGLHQGVEMIIHKFRLQVENLQALDSKIHSIERKVKNIKSNGIYLINQQLSALRKSLNSILS